MWLVPHVVGVGGLARGGQGHGTEWIRNFGLFGELFWRCFSRLVSYKVGSEAGSGGGARAVRFELRAPTAAGKKGKNKKKIEKEGP